MAKKAPLTAYAEGGCDHAEDRRDDLRAAFAAHRARSLAGGLCQVAEAEHLMEDLYDLIDKPEHEAQRLRRTFIRLLCSVAMHLEVAAGQSVEHVGVEAFMPPNLNPWIRTEDSVAWVSSKNAEEAA